MRLSIRTTTTANSRPARYLPPMRQPMINDMPTFGEFFLDSGAHSLHMKFRGSGSKFHETDAFWEYVDGYAAFVKEHEEEIDYYVNVDVIFDPEMSWRV